MNIILCFFLSFNIYFLNIDNCLFFLFLLFFHLPSQQKQWLFFVNGKNLETMTTESTTTIINEDQDCYVHDHDLDLEQNQKNQQILMKNNININSNNLIDSDNVNTDMFLLKKAYTYAIGYYRMLMHAPSTSTEGDSDLSSKININNNGKERSRNGETQQQGDYFNQKYLIQFSHDIANIEQGIKLGKLTKEDFDCNIEFQLLKNDMVIMMMNMNNNNYNIKQEKNYQILRPQFVSNVLQTIASLNQRLLIKDYFFVV